jgi:hypothetical protein
MNERIGLGIRTHPDTKPTICTDSLPVRKTFFLLDRPVKEPAADRFFPVRNGSAGAVVRTFFASCAKGLD